MQQPRPKIKRLHVQRTQRKRYWYGGAWLKHQLNLPQERDHECTTLRERFAQLKLQYKQQEDLIRRLSLSQASRSSRRNCYLFVSLCCAALLILCAFIEASLRNR